MYIALSDDLIEEFLAYKGNSFNKVSIELFKYLHPFKIGKYQQNLFAPEILKQLGSSPVFVHFSSALNEIDLIKDTEFKIMLTKDRNDYPYINILGDEIDVNFNAFYKANDDRSKAIEHIKALLNDANNIEIIDEYLFKSLPSSSQWEENFKLLKYILPLKPITINVTTVKLVEQEKFFITQMKTYSKNVWNIPPFKIKKGIHDRYIKTDKVTILLSSGIDYLHDISKDLTYLVRNN